MSASLRGGHVIEGDRLVRVDDGGGAAVVGGEGEGEWLAGGPALLQAVAGVAGALGRAAGAPAAAVRDGMASRDRGVATLSTFVCVRARAGWWRHGCVHALLLLLVVVVVVGVVVVVVVVVVCVCVCAFVCVHLCASVCMWCVCV